MLGGHTPESMRPVVRREGGDWERLPGGAPEELPDGRFDVGWLMDAPETHADIAFCYPYGRPEVEAVVKDTAGYWRTDTIGASPGARPIIRLCNSCGEKNSDRPGLYLISRQHSGETPGSWTLDGFLRHIATLGEGAPLVWAVPLTNMDGVEGGDYGKDNFPFDLNRSWGIPAMRHEVLVMQRDMQRWRERCRPALGIDFHAPGACESDGIYVYLPDPEKHPDRHEAVKEWAAAFEKALAPEYLSKDFARVAKYATRWDTPRFGDYCFGSLGVPEISFETPYATSREIVFTRERYREAGAQIAAAVVGKLGG